MTLQGDFFMAVKFFSEHHVNQIAHVAHCRHIAIGRAGVNRGGFKLIAEHFFSGREKFILLTVGKTDMTFRLTGETVLAQNA